VNKENPTINPSTTSNSQINSKPKEKPQAFASLLPIFAFIKPYKMMLALALVALLLTSAVSLSLGQGVKFVIDSGFIAGSVEQLQTAILVLFNVLAWRADQRRYS